MNARYQLIAFAMAVLLHTTCIQQVHCIATRDPQGKVGKLETCPKKIWKVISFDEEDITLNGNVQLQFALPATERIGMKYEAILACEGLVINGTGHQILRVKKGVENLAKFNLHPPVARDEEESLVYGKDLNHSCTFELRHISKMAALKKAPSIIMQCQIRVRSYMHRILPSCDLERSKRLIEEIEVFREQGQIQIHLKHSSNDIVTIDHDCRVGNELGHNKTDVMEKEIFPLSLPGADNSAMLVAFYPPCNTFNQSIRELYTHKRMDDCHLEIFSICQEGMISIREMKIDFDDDAMLCHPPKPGYVEALEDLEMRFRIESKPVVGLICLLIINGGLYLSIIPFAISRCVRFVIKKIRSIEKSKKKEPSTTKAHMSLAMDGSPPMEYDDVETTLFGKLSKDDIHDFILDSGAGEDPFPSHLVVEADIEVVCTQPIGEKHSSDGDIIPHSHSKQKRLKKRKSKSDHSHKKHKSISHTKSKEKAHKRTHKHHKTKTLDIKSVPDETTPKATESTIPVPPPPPPIKVQSVPPAPPPPSLPPLITGTSPLKPSRDAVREPGTRANLMNELEAKLRTKSDRVTSSAPSSPRIKHRTNSASPGNQGHTRELN